MKATIVILVVLAIAVTVNGQWHPKASDLDEFLGESGLHATLKADSQSFINVRHKLLNGVKRWATKTLIDNEVVPGENAEQYPYFHWIPPYKTSIRVDGGVATWEGICFKNNTATAKSNANGTVTVTVTRSNQQKLFCSDMYLFATVSGIMLETFSAPGVSTILWVPANDSTTGEVWDLRMKGIRVCIFLDDFVQTVANLLSTVNLFVSEFVAHVPDEVAKANLDFMAKYANRKMGVRNTQHVPVDESLINSGDFMGVVRLDGLDPMLAWAMGSSTGHTVIALRMDGKLYITESTTNGAYWPTNGIQKTEYATWIKQAQAADYQVVWAPLSAAARANFNETAAIARFKELEGLDYGYHNMLWAWIDTIKDNYPCVAPTFTQCLQWEHVEMLFNWLDRFVPPVGDLLWDEAMNIRVGTVGKRIADVWQAAAEKGMDAKLVPMIVEQDSWNYHTLRNGKPTIDKSMVCCVYVCNVWKAAGVFKDINSDFNCAEMTNWDDYSLSIFDTITARPSQCVSADPSNTNCQLEGKYTLQLNDYASHKAYPHMAEKCPSLAPDYKKPSDC